MIVAFMPASFAPWSLVSRCLEDGMVCEEARFTRFTSNADAYVRIHSLPPAVDADRLPIETSRHRCGRAND
jgi:hypothetical protein